MTQQLALVQARRLQDIARSKGLECVIDLKPDSGGRWLEPMANRVGHLAHHVYSKQAHGVTRFYQMVRNGDPSRDLPGPLANFYMGWDGVARIITLGRANHPGRGGPLTLAGKTIPKDNARPYLLGTEFEGGWIADEWSPWFRERMALWNGSVLELIGRPVEAHAEHLTWAPGRKNDRLGYTAARGRDEIRRALAGAPTTPTTDPSDDPSEEDPMIIFRTASSGPHGCLATQGHYAILTTAEEKKNLLAAGAREIWVEQRTLDALIAESRGQYDTVAIRGTVAVRETPKTL